MTTEALATSPAIVLTGFSRTFFLRPLFRGRSHVPR
jgi:hypothetical protein